MPINLGSTEIVDRYIGDKLIEKVYLGSNEIFNAYTTISDNLPILYNTRAQYPLKDYTVYGTVSGSGDNSYNLCSVTPLEATWATPVPLLKSAVNALPLGTYTISCKLRLLTRPNPTDTEIGGIAVMSNSTLPNQNIVVRPRLRNAQVGDVVNIKVTFSITSNNIGSYTNAYAYGCGREGYGATGSAELFDFVINEGSEAFPYGYKIPLTNTGENSQSETYPLYIGSTKLGEEEYVNFGEQKIYKLKDVHTDTVTINGIEWDILGYDHDVVYKADGTLAQHTVTIQTHNAQPIVQFDAPEAWYYAENGLVAGTYYFTIDPTYDTSRNTYKDSGYQFVLTQSVPAGGVLTLLWAANTQASGLKISSYATTGATTAIESNIAVSEGTSGTNLGELTVAGDPTNNRNSILRARSGSNNYKESAIRQYLNSDKAAGSVWTPQTKFDRPPSWVASSNGFLYGVDSDFLSVLGNAQKATSKNTVTDGGGTETTSEKMFLLSMTEAYCGGSEGTAYSFFKNYSDLSAAGGGADTNRIKYRNNAAKVWWLRSPYPSSAYNPRSVTTSGVLHYSSSSSSFGVVPACCVILDDINTNPYLQSLFLKPTDPPVPFPAITAYLGDNILSSTQTLGNTSITYRINNNNIITDNLPIIYTGRTNNNLKDYIIYGSSIGSGVATSTGEPEGYYIPITNTNNSTIDNYNLYIGTTKLTNEEYISYKEQKIYKMIDNVLTPIDPPSPFPPIQTYIGENIITSSELLGQVTIKDTIDDILDKPIIYGYHIDPTNSNPDNSVIYLKDAIGKNPASMGSTTFNYGDWENAFFMPKPCMVKYNGTVDYYLDENDYNYKAEDGLISTNNLPLNYKSRTETTLNNYTIYGSASGSGVQTENLFDKDAKDTNNGYISGSYLLSDGTMTGSSLSEISEYISVKPNTKYIFTYNGSSLSAPSIGFYNEAKEFIEGKSYSGVLPKTVTTTSETKYIRFSLRKNYENNAMFVEGTDLPESYIPYGYKIPLTNTGENSQSSTYPLYIGSTKLSEEDFLSYADQKIYTNIETFTFDGTEYWAYYGEFGGHQMFYRDVSQIETLTEFKYLYCNKYQATDDVSVATIEGSKNKIIRYQRKSDKWNISRIYIADDNYNNITDFKAHLRELYLSGDPLIISYQTASTNVLDPPVPFPSITIYEGQNTLSSTETLGNVSISNVMVPSDISNQAYEGNAMIEWPKIYYKFEEGNIEGEGYFYCSNKKVDSSYDCYCNIDSNNNEIDHFYTAIYNGTSVLDYSNASTYKIGDYAIYNGSQYKALVNQTAPAAYSADATYAVGDLCTYSSKRYECNTAIETAEAWTAAHWTEIPNSSTWDINNWTLITNTPVTNMRSLSGVRTAPINGNGNTTGSTEVTRATANNTTASVEWYIDTLADRMLINGLLILISKSLNTQAKFGQGITSGSQAGKEAYITGSLNDKGMFYGNTSGTTTAVKVFGMENWWGLVWHRTAGLIGGSSNRFLYKLTYNTYDGSTATSYNSNGTNYLVATNNAGNNLVRPSTNNYVNKCNYGKYGYLPIGTGSPASASACYCDYYYNGTGSLLVGGSSSSTAIAGCSCFYLSRSFAYSSWNFAGALSLKPLGTVN